MRNKIYTHVKLKRIDICDLLLAVDHLMFEHPDSTKWKVLHYTLMDSLEELDEQIDSLFEESEDNKDE